MRIEKIGAPPKKWWKYACSFCMLVWSLSRMSLSACVCVFILRVFNRLYYYIMLFFVLYIHTLMPFDFKSWMHDSSTASQTRTFWMSTGIFNVKYFATCARLVKIQLLKIWRRKKKKKKRGKNNGWNHMNKINEIYSEHSVAYGSYANVFSFSFYHSNSVLFVFNNLPTKIVKIIINLILCAICGRTDLIMCLFTETA